LQISDIIIINDEKAKILDIIKGQSKHTKAIIILLEGDNLGSEFTINLDDLIKQETK
jgi:hypothetical protein